MKGNVFEGAWIIVDAVILVFIFTIVLIKILGAFNPNQQIAEANTALLVDSINRACVKGQATLDRFSLPQQKPSKLYGTSDFLPTFAIMTRGDPQFVLYYEAFPIGEGVGWEVYQDFPVRIFSPYNPGGTPQLIEFENNLWRNERNYITTVRNKAKQHEIEGVVLVPNIMLSNYRNAIPTEEPESTLPGNADSDDTGYSLKTGNLGVWKNDNPPNEPDFFEFSNYMGLTSMEKSFIKYRPCGENTLCLKTPTGIQRFPLHSSCRDIDYIQLVYDARSKWGPTIKKFIFGHTVGGAGAALGKISSIIKFALPGLGTLGSILKIGGVAIVADSLLKYHLTYKVSDFYLASPCTLKGDIKIEKTVCTKLEDHDRVCTRWLKYPMYNIKDDEKGSLTLDTIGDHYQCMENIGRNLETKDKAKDKPNGKCIRITVSEYPGDYCWTSEPYKDTYTGDNLFLKIYDYLTDNTQWWVYWHSYIGTTPITGSTNYFTDPESILIETSHTSLTSLNEFLDAVERKVSWGWPG